MLKDKVKKYRKDNKLTQAELGSLIGISRGYVSDIESGKVGGTIDIVKKLSDVSNLPISYWLKDDPEFEKNYTTYSSLNTLIEAMVDAGKIDIKTGNMNTETVESLIKVLKAEIILKYK
ncbi:MAG: helix-turn-helix domain-containing protein [Clostridium cadaveris]